MKPIYWKVPEISYTSNKSNLILAKSIVVLFMNLQLLLFSFFSSFEATQKMWLEAERSHSLRFPAKSVPLFPFHLMFIILPYQRKRKSVIRVTGKALCRSNWRKTGWRLSQERRNLIVSSLSTEGNGHVKWSWVNCVINSSLWKSVSSLHVIRGGQGWKGFFLELLLFYFLRLLWQHPPPSYAQGCCKALPNLAFHQCTSALCIKLKKAPHPPGRCQTHKS